MIKRDMSHALKKAQEKRAEMKEKGIKPKTWTQKAKENPKSMRAAVNAKCFDCMGFQRAEVAKCTHLECSLYDFRPYKG